MAFKILTFACVLAVARAGIIAQYSPQVSHYSAPQVSHYAAPQVSHYAAPQVSHYAAPQVSHYSAPVQVAHYSAPQVSYSHAPQVSYSHAPQVSYSHAPAQVHQYVAPAKVAIAAPVAHYAPVKVAHYEHEEEYGPAEYSFEYSVHDEHTGDIKSQKETRHGDQVEGEYSLVEADGSHRVVKYTADKHSGFNAVVHREPGAHPVQAKPVLVKPVVKVAAPVVYAQAAPVHHGYAHAAPAQTYSYAHSAPAQSYYHH